MKDKWAEVMIKSVNRYFQYNHNEVLSEAGTRAYADELREERQLKPMGVHRVFREDS